MSSSMVAIVPTMPGERHALPEAAANEFRDHRGQPQMRQKRIRLPRRKVVAIGGPAFSPVLS
jgi:hypothetical protein